MIGFIADIGANHDGDLTRALRLIQLAAESGATVVKYQHFRADHIVSEAGFAALPKLAHQAAWTESVVEVYRKASLPWEWTPVLAQACADAGVEFMSTPYDLEAVAHLNPYVKRWKIGSGDITYRALLEAVARTGKPVILSTGASTATEIWPALHALGWPNHAPTSVMQCLTNYTGDGCPNVAMLREGSFYDGLSDHSPGHIAACAAVALGATVIEKHFTDDRTRHGPDHGFAMTPDDWRAMVDACNQTLACLGDGIKKVEPNERESRIVQRRAWWGTPEGWKALRPCPADALTPMDSPPVNVVVGDYARKP